MHTHTHTHTHTQRARVRTHLLRPAAPFNCAPIHPPAHPPACPSACPPACSSACPPACPPVGLLVSSSVVTIIWLAGAVQAPNSLLEVESDATTTGSVGTLVPLVQSPPSPSTTSNIITSRKSADSCRGQAMRSAYLHNVRTELLLRRCPSKATIAQCSLPILTCPKHRDQSTSSVVPCQAKPPHHHHPWPGVRFSMRKQKV